MHGTGIAPVQSDPWPSPRDRDLTGNRDWTSRFRINNYAQWQKRPHTSPKKYQFFGIPEKMLAATKCEDAKSPIIVEHATIGLSFEAWQRKH